MFDQDRRVLRKLAYAYQEVMYHPRNFENRALHQAVNDLKPIRPVVLIDEIPFHEINYDGSLTLRCEHPYLRQIEYYMRTTLFQWKHFPADMIVKPFIPIEKKVSSTGIGIKVKDEILVGDEANNIVAHKYEDQLAEEEAVDRLQIPVITYEEQQTQAAYQLVAEMIGDIVPVKIVGHGYYITTWDDIAMYRGVNNLLIDLIDRPEYTHRLVEKLTQIAISIGEQYEALGLFELGKYDVHCTPALTNDLPSKDFDGEKVRRKDIWGRGAAQIFASVSKDMHEAFDIEYMKRIMEPMGLVYYGCCEPLHNKIDIVEKIPHLRKISITPWADIDVAAEIIGKKYVLANKPNPAFLSTSKLNHEVVTKEVERTLQAVKRNNCSCDIVLKDISSVGYRIENLIEWEKIVMERVKEGV